MPKQGTTDTADFYLVSIFFDHLEHILKQPMEGTHSDLQETDFLNSIALIYLRTTIKTSLGVRFFWPVYYQLVPYFFAVSSTSLFGVLLLVNPWWHYPDTSKVL